MHHQAWRHRQKGLSLSLSPSTSPPFFNFKDIHSATFQFTEINLGKTGRRKKKTRRAVKNVSVRNGKAEEGTRGGKILFSFSYPHFSDCEIKHSDEKTVQCSLLFLSVFEMCEMLDERRHFKGNFLSLLLLSHAFTNCVPF
jgi:hypothetical protein